MGMLASRGKNVNKQLFYITLLFQHKGLSRTGMELAHSMNINLSPRTYEELLSEHEYESDHNTRWFFNDKIPGTRRSNGILQQWGPGPPRNLFPVMNVHLEWYHLLPPNIHISLPSLYLFHYLHWWPNDSSYPPPPGYVLSSCFRSPLSLTPTMYPLSSRTYLSD